MEVPQVAFNRRAGGHSFDFITEVCAKCGMTRAKYEDSGRPRCAGVVSSDRKKELGAIPTDSDD